jgi:hypothetical protein
MYFACKKVKFRFFKISGTFLVISSRCYIVSLVVVPPAWNIVQADTTAE